MVIVGQPGSTRFDSESTSRSLLERAKASDAEAWQRLVALYGPLVFSWCRRAGLRQEDASDVFQESFAAVAAGIAQFHRDRPGDTFRGWLRVIAGNQIRLHFRRQTDRPPMIGGVAAHVLAEETMDAPSSVPEPSADQEERLDLFRRGLEMIRSQFEVSTWEAFWQMTVEGRSATEVAGQLGMTAGAVRQAKYVVLRRLRSELGDLLE